MKFTAAFLALFISLSLGAQTNVKMLVGTYTKGKSEGIYVYDFNTSNAESKMISSVKTSNPSYLTISPNKKFVYAVNEDGDSVNNGGGISAFSFDKKNSTLKFINEQKTGGNHPCYVTIDKTGKWLFVANYSGGSFAEFAVKPTGGVAPAKTVEQFVGKGADPSRQEGPHAHTTVITADNKYLMVTDLGRDKILTYPFDASSGSLAKKRMVATTVIGGSGPRHIAFSPSQKFVYVIQELNGTIAGFAVLPGAKLKLLQTISSVPEGYTGSFGGADIHVSPDGKFLYASNRGESNTIAIFSIDNAGLLKAIGHQPTGGTRPRNFNFDPSGNFLLVANQDTNNIVVFSIDHKTGLLTDTGKTIEVPNPVCIQWIK